MNERIVHDIQITETEEGFRIEIKGDKEILRRWIDRAGTFFANMGERHAREPFRGHGPFDRHEHEQHPPFRGHGPFDRHEHEHQHFGGFGPFGRGPSREERDALREQMHEWQQQAREWKHDLREQMREWRRHGGPFGWNVSPEERDAWVQQAQEWRDQLHRQFTGEGQFGPQSGREPFPWRGRREKRKRGRYDLGPWWDEGEALDDLPTV